MRTIEEIQKDVELVNKYERLTNIEAQNTIPATHYYPYYIEGKLFKDELALAVLDGIPLDRLKEICEAERDGRCVVLPCKVGGEVWYIEQRKIVRGVVDGYLWYRSCRFALNVVWDEPIMEHFGYSRREVPFRDIGTIFFLTREAAEKKLEGLK